MMNQEMAVPSGLARSNVEAFAASVATLPRDEMRRAKLLFVRNEIAQLRAIRESNSGWRIGTILMFLMPLAWPALYATRKTMRVNAELQEERVRNAMAAWSYDLDGHNDSLREALEAALQS